MDGVKVNYALSLLKGIVLSWCVLELCTQIRSPDGNQMIQGDWVTSTKGGWSFMFRIADALELHRSDRGKKEYLSVGKTI